MRLLTLVMLVAITLLRVDFGPMKRHEMNAIAGDLFTTPGRPYEGNEEEVIKENSHVLDLNSSSSRFDCKLYYFNDLYRWIF